MRLIETGQLRVWKEDLEIEFGRRGDADMHEVRAFLILDPFEANAGPAWNYLYKGGREWHYESFLMVSSVEML